MTVQKFNISSPVPHLSASSLKLASGCLRAWWFTYVIGLRQPEGYEHLYGKRLHAALERYQMGQDPFPAGWDKGLAKDDIGWLREQIGHAIAKGIVTSRKTQQIEAQIAALIGTGHLDARGLPIQAAALCTVDAAGERRPVAPTHYHPDKRVAGILAGLALSKGWGDLGYLAGFMDVIDTSLPLPKVSDHKTTKHRGYAKTPKSLALDLQMLIYAAIALGLRPDATAVDLQHNVFIKRGRDAAEPTEDTVYAVNCRVTLEEVVAHWKQVIDQAEKIAKVRNDFPADLELWDQVPGAVNPLERRNLFGADACGKEPEACRAYKGCAFKDACFKRASVQSVVAKVKNAKPPTPPQITNTKPTQKKVVDSAGQDAGSGPRTPFKGRQPANTQPGAKMPFVPKKPPAPYRPMMNDWVFVKDPDTAGVAYHALVTNSFLPNDQFMVILDHTDRSTGILSPAAMAQAEMQGRTIVTTLGLADLFQNLPAGHEVRAFSMAATEAAEQAPSSEVVINNPTPEPTQVLQQPTPDADAALAGAKDGATHPVAQEVKRRPGRPASKAAPQPVTTTVIQTEPAPEPTAPAPAVPPAQQTLFSITDEADRAAFADAVADKAVEKLKAWVLSQLAK